MNPLFLALGAGALVYAVTRPSKASTPERARITYQMARAVDWAPKGMIPAKIPPENEFIIVGSKPRGEFRAKVVATKLPDGFYVIDKVLFNEAPGLDIIEGLDHGWLWVPKRDASGSVVVDDKGQEVWVEAPLTP